MSTGRVPRPLVVMHSLPTWLPTTETWQHTQVSRLPAGRVESHVVCDRVENLERFPVAHLHAPPERLRALGRLERGLVRLGALPYKRLLVRASRRHGADLLHSHFGNTGCWDRAQRSAWGCPRW